MNKNCRSALLLILILTFTVTACSSQGRMAVTSTTMEWAAVQPNESNLFTRAEKPRVFVFPQDHGTHLDFQTEWWYFTGNLQADNGRSFGYQLTFFRRALSTQNQMAARTSDLAVDQIYMAHFTLTDVANNQFHPFQRLDRGDGKMAGATTDPYLHVWLADWQVNQIDGKQFQLQAKEDGVQIDLVLTDQDGIVLQGENGLSRKSDVTASYYYSMPRLATTGTVQVDNQAYQVNGSSWLDHEFSTSALASDQVGWDWFALHLDDGKDIMLYTIRRADGTNDPYSSGSLVWKDQRPIQLAIDQFSITPLGTWKSPRSGALYPSGWRLSIPSREIDLTITPLIKDQELVLSFTYWEGAVSMDGTVNGIPVKGTGYVELTGYAASMRGQF